MHLKHPGASLVAQTVKRLPAMRETQVQSLAREDPLEKDEEIPQVQDKRNPSRMVGVAREHQRADTLKP